MKKVEIVGLSTIPEIEFGFNLADIIVGCAKDEAGGIQERDIIIVTSKIVSKAEGNMVKLGEIKPGKKALAISRKTGKSAAKVQLVLDTDQEIIAVIPLAGLAKEWILRSARQRERALQLLEMERCMLLTRDNKGRVYNLAGIDSSNHPDDLVSLPPSDPDRSAQELRHDIKKLTGKEVAVLIADTQIVPFGSMDLATGSAGIVTVTKRFGEEDRFGKPKFGGMDITAYELTAAASLLFGQADEGIPVVIVRGLDYEVSEEQNILNTLVADRDQLRSAVASALVLTASIGGLKDRILSWLLRWLVKT